MNGKARIRYLANEARTIMRVVGQPDSRWLVRGIAPAVAAYFSLIHLIPTIILVTRTFTAVRAFELRSR